MARGQGFLGRLLGLFRREPESRFQWLSVRVIAENPRNVRDPNHWEGFDELKASITKFGILVPLLVSPERGKYRLIAGHRRLRAAKELGLESVPTVVRRIERAQVTEVALAENQHRVGLNALEIARAFDRVATRKPNADARALADEMGLKWDDIEAGRAIQKMATMLQECVIAGALDLERARVLDEVEDAEVLSELIELVAEESLDIEETRAVVDRVLRREPTFVTTPEARHFHSRECPFVQTIPEDRKLGLYSRKEGRRWGKIACMNCL